MENDVVIKGQDVERFLNDHDKSELSRIIWKVEQLKAADNDPNQQRAELIDHVLILTESEE